ncbi:DUF6950 family protein [Rhodovulum euryhalinum]|uniref:DUF6950 domain-containing protein n=1 Tax=Rhodovulum euryhalinum TaxID=35805 RepID=A0A4R2KPI3_9RHOB|nr:hypothetical protein [Rhodovulum euryhalinum]TCO68505.1 hypothetical protein EV655_12712 [Rhodovulum euryhalinum]
MRAPGWEGRLAAAVEAARARPFAWGEHDCATWAFGVRRELTGGPDLAAAWRGRYRTAPGAARVLRRLGWSSMAEAGRALLGPPRATVRQAGRGDLVLDGEGAAFGVCLGARAAFLAPEGLSFRPLGSCSLAWRT